MKNIMRAIEKLGARITNESVRHILLNYSESEIGFRHPKSPVGAVLRDQGQADIYAGLSRLILTVDGQALLKSDQVGISGRGIYLNSPSIESIKFLSKNISPAIFNGRKVATFLKEDISDVWVIGPATRVDPETGEIINKLSLKDVLEPKLFFEASPEDTTVDSRVQKYAIMAKAMAGQ